MPIRSKRFIRIGVVFLLLVIALLLFAFFFWRYYLVPSLDSSTTVSRISPSSSPQFVNLMAIPPLEPSFTWEQAPDDLLPPEIYITYNDDSLPITLPGQLWVAYQDRVANDTFNTQLLDVYYRQRLEANGWQQRATLGMVMIQAPAADGPFGSVDGLVAVTSTAARVVAWSYFVTDFDRTTLTRNLRWSVFVSEIVTEEQLKAIIQSSTSP